MFRILVLQLTIIFGISSMALAEQKITFWALESGIYDVLLTAPDEKISLNDMILELTQKAAQDLMGGKSVSKKGYEALLDGMALDLKQRIGEAAASEQVITLINDYLFAQKGFGVDRSRLFEGSLESLILNQVLDNKKGNCLSLSLIYLLLAERLDLPFYGVMIPGHFFIRYEEGNFSKNIEVTDQGNYYSDNHYREGFGRYIGDDRALVRLSKREVVAVYLANLANYYKLMGAEEKAVEILQNVVMVIPDRASVYVNLGNAHERRGDIFKAIMYYQKALSLNPFLCEAHYNLGLAHFLYTKMPEAARRSGNIARQLGCRLHPRFRAFLEDGR